MIIIISSKPEKNRIDFDQKLRLPSAHKLGWEASHFLTNNLCQALHYSRSSPVFDLTLKTDSLLVTHIRFLF